MVTRGLFWFLLQNFLCASDCMLLIMGLVAFSVAFNEIIYMSLHIKSSAAILYRCFKVSSIFFISWLKSPVDTLYMLNVINLDDLIFSSMAQILFYTVIWNVNFAEMKICTNKNHVPLFHRFWWQELDSNIWSGSVRCCRSCSSMWCLLKHSTWGLMLCVSKEFINSLCLLLSCQMFWWKICSESDKSTVLSLYTYRANFMCFWIFLYLCVVASFCVTCRDLSILC